MAPGWLSSSGSEACRVAFRYRPRGATLRDRRLTFPEADSQWRRFQVAVRSCSRSARTAAVRDTIKQRLPLRRSLSPRINTVVPRSGRGAAAGVPKGPMQGESHRATPRTADASRISPASGRFHRARDAGSAPPDAAPGDLRHLAANIKEGLPFQPWRRAFQEARREPTVRQPGCALPPASPLQYHLDPQRRQIYPMPGRRSSSTSRTTACARFIPTGGLCPPASRSRTGRLPIGRWRRYVRRGVE